MTDHPVDHKALFNQTPVTRFLVKKSGDSFVVVETNNIANQFFNKDKAEIIGQPIEHLFSASNAKHMAESFKACLSKKTTVTVVAPLPNFPGSVQVPGFWINPVYDSNDQILWLDIIGHPNSTNSSIVERERDDALLLLTSIFDVSEVGILVSDRNRRIVKVNDSFERIYGWNRKDSLGKDFVDFVTEDERKIAEGNHEEYITDGVGRSGEVKVMCKDGSIANAIYTTATLELSHGRRFQVTTLVDITSRKQMEFSLRLAKEQADSSNHAKSAFLANMSHELRTPLNAIIGFSEMMMKETFGPMGHEKYAEYMGDVHLSARHLLEIINEVLDMSKIEAGRVELHEQDIDLVSLCDSVVRIVASRIFSSDLEIKLESVENFPKLYADPRLVRQILINLITNAVKYSSEGGLIKVTPSLTEAGEISVAVVDQGVGIPADRIQEAMEPFGQINEPTTSSAYQGTGLGLPLAKAMTEMHGGRFTLTSEVDQGTKVTITFPSSRAKILNNTEDQEDDDAGIELKTSAE
jgi:PAS domain S-box-containing protein